MLLRLVGHKTSGGKKQMAIAQHFRVICVYEAQRPCTGRECELRSSCSARLKRNGPFDERAQSYIQLLSSWHSLRKWRYRSWKAAFLCVNFNIRSRNSQVERFLSPCRYWRTFCTAESIGNFLFRSPSKRARRTAAVTQEARERDTSWFENHNFAHNHFRASTIRVRTVKECARTKTFSENYVAGQRAASSIDHA